MDSSTIRQAYPKLTVQQLCAAIERGALRPTVSCGYYLFQGGALVDLLRLSEEAVPSTVDKGYSAEDSGVAAPQIARARSRRFIHPALLI